MCSFTNRNYINIPGFAITELGLSGNELIAFSIIYGFCQDGSSVFSGSLGYLSTAMNITRQNVSSVLKRLAGKGLIEKIEKQVNGVKLCDYRLGGGVAETITPVLNQCGGVAESVTGGVTESAHHNSNKDISIDNSIYRGTTESLCLFANSRFASFEAFQAQFQKPEYQQIDIYYYWRAIADWSAQGGKKKRDWIATARNFMRGDNEKGRLHRTGGVALSPDAIKYLEMGNKLFDD